MKPLIFLALLLCVATGAGAHEVSDWEHNHDAILGFDTPPETVILEEESSLDRFLREEVDSEIKIGDGYRFPQGSSESMDQLRATISVASYLKALVLIERERLKRGEGR